MAADRPTLLIALEPRVLSGALERVLVDMGFVVVVLEDGDRGPRTSERYDVVLKERGADADFRGDMIIDLSVASGEVVATSAAGASTPLSSVAEMLDYIGSRQGAGTRAG